MSSSFSFMNFRSKPPEHLGTNTPNCGFAGASVIRSSFAKSSSGFTGGTSEKDIKSVPNNSLRAFNSRNSSFKVPNFGFAGATFTKVSSRASGEEKKLSETVEAMEALSLRSFVEPESGVVHAQDSPSIGEFEDAEEDDGKWKNLRRYDEVKQEDAPRADTTDISSSNNNKNVVESLSLDTFEEAEEDDGKWRNLRRNDNRLNVEQKSTTAHKKNVHFADEQPKENSDSGITSSPVRPIRIVFSDNEENIRRPIRSSFSDCQEPYYPYDDLSTSVPWTRIEFTDSVQVVRPVNTWLGLKDEVLPTLKQETVEEDSESADDIVSSLVARPAPSVMSFSNFLGEDSKVSVELAPPETCSRFMNNVTNSLGVCYDAVFQNFLATCSKTGKVFCYETKQPIATGLGRATAIAVVEPGISFVVISDKGISQFTASKPLASDHTQRMISRNVCARTARGLGVTESGNIVTVVSSRDIVIFKNDEGAVDETVCCFDYAGSLGPCRKNANACFLDVRKNRLVTSDLGCNRLSAFSIDESANGTSIQCLLSIDVTSPINNRIPPLDKCSFIAGVQLDDEGNVLVVDARGGTIQFFDSSLTFLARARQVNRGTKLPYISDIAVAPNGSAVGCARKMEGVVPMRLFHSE